MSGHEPSGDFDCEVCCRCGACLDRYVSSWSHGDPVYDYADPDTGLTADACPQCGQSVAAVVADDASERERAAP
jgi:hypothetical protein